MGFCRALPGNSAQPNRQKETHQMYARPSTGVSGTTEHLDQRISALADRVEYLSDLRMASVGRTAMALMAEGHMDSLPYLASLGYARQAMADLRESRMLRQEASALRRARWDAQ
jgi:hypothetical protein